MYQAKELMLGAITICTRPFPKYSLEDDPFTRSCLEIRSKRGPDYPASKCRVSPFVSPSACAPFDTPHLPAAALDFLFVSVG